MQTCNPQLRKGRCGKTIVKIELWKGNRRKVIVERQLRRDNCGKVTANGNCGKVIFCNPQFWKVNCRM